MAFRKALRVKIIGEAMLRQPLPPPLSTAW
jgi:hypothetical protein